MLETYICECRTDNDHLIEPEWEDEFELLKSAASELSILRKDCDGGDSHIVIAETKHLKAVAWIGENDPVIQISVHEITAMDIPMNDWRNS